MSKLISKISGDFPTGIIIGKYKKGRIVKKSKGPKKTKFFLKPYELNLKIKGTTADEKEITGECIIKYDFDVNAYLNSLNNRSESVDELEKKLSREMSHDLSGIIRDYRSDELLTNEKKNYLEDQIKKRSKISFLKKGIKPYKITTRWKISYENEEYYFIIDSIKKISSELKKEASNLNKLEQIKKAKDMATKTLRFTNYFGGLRKKAFEEIYDIIYGRILENPYKKPSEYITEKEVLGIVENVKKEGLDVLIDQNA